MRVSKRALIFSFLLAVGAGLFFFAPANFVTGCGGGGAVSTTGPTVDFTAPLNGATGVFLNWNITATFSEAMDPATVTASTIGGRTFSLKQGTTDVPGTVSYTGLTAIFDPTSDLSPNTEYTATITTAAKSVSGNALVAEKVLTFTTGSEVDTTAPTVTFTVPLNGDTGVYLNRRMAITFSKPMDPTTITTTTVTLSQGGAAVSGTLTYTGVSAVFAPDANLLPDTVYTAMVTTGAMDVAGLPLANDYVWSFTTGATSDTIPPTVTLVVPANAATSVPLNQQVVATFSKYMDPATINGATFTLMQGATPVYGDVIYTVAGKTATFIPTSDLSPNTVYTATITTGAKSLAGLPLAANEVWSFTTGAAIDTTPPTITLLSPEAGAIGVCKGDGTFGKTIAATFDKDMQPLTITAAGSFTVAGITGLVTYDPLTRIAAFVPTADLAPGTLYTATITTAVQDLAGNAMAANRVWSFTTGATTCQSSVPLGAAGPFAIMAMAAITDSPTSAITGDVGLNPGSADNITGFSDPGTCPEVTGTMYKVDAGGPACAVNVGAAPNVISLAQTAALAAYNNVAARGSPVAISGNLAGLTLYPGLYESSDTILISVGGKLYLDAQGDINAVFVIRGTSDMTTSTDSEVVLTGGAQAKNVYWALPTAVTLGTTSIMKGTMIAGTALTLLDHANLEGRAMNQGGSATQITCNACTITLPLP